MTILIADDHPTNRKLLRAVLEAERHAVLEAEDGEEALAVLANVAADAVITDVLMPKMDGYRLCHALRSDERLRHLPVLVYTATYTAESDERMSLELGADRFIRKPAAPAEIIAALQEVLKEREQGSPNFTLRPQNLELMQQYSQRLVDTLEEKNLQLEKQALALQHSEGRLRQIFDSANDAMLLVRFHRDGRPGEFIDANEVASQMLGYSRAELLTRTTLDLDSPEEATTFAEIAERLRTEKRIVFERTLVASDGRRIPTEISGRLFAAGDEILGIAVIRDVSERKQAERMRSSIALSLSHELNTPLNGILGMVQLLELAGDAPAPADLREAVAGIRESADRLQALVQRNLDFAQIELLAAGTPKNGRGAETSNFPTRVKQIAADMARRHGRPKDVQVEVTVSAVPIWDRWITRLLTELLDNALKFSAPGTPVRLLATTDGERIKLSVVDQGRGMTMEQVAALGAFIQFERQHYEQQGVGLGLYLARRIAELHGGTLQIRPAIGTGTSITATLRAPVRPPPA